MKPACIAMGLITLAFAAAGPAHAQTLGRLEVVDLAKHVEILADDLASELYQNHQHDLGFRGAYREADRLYGAAEHLHDLVNVNIGQRGYVRGDRADEIFRYSSAVRQHLRRLQHEMRFILAGEPAPYGYRHSTAYRHPGTSRLERKMRELEESTELLLSDLRRGL